MNRSMKIALIGVAVVASTITINTTSQTSPSVLMTFSNNQPSEAMSAEASAINNFKYQIGDPSILRVDFGDGYIGHTYVYIPRGPGCQDMTGLEC